MVHRTCQRASARGRLRLPRVPEVGDRASGGKGLVTHAIAAGETTGIRRVVLVLSARQLPPSVGQVVLKSPGPRLGEAAAPEFVEYAHGCIARDEVGGKTDHLDVGERGHLRVDGQRFLAPVELPKRPPQSHQCSSLDRAIG